MHHREKVEAAIQGMKRDALRSLDCFVASLLAMTIPLMGCLINRPSP
jgi:hypothetical protein